LTARRQKEEYLPDHGLVVEWRTKEGHVSQDHQSELLQRNSASGPLDRYRRKSLRFLADVREVLKTVVVWSIVACAFRLVAPTDVLDALVPSSAGAQTMLQIVTPAIIAVFALALASVFVLAQHTAAIYGAGVVRSMVLDRKLRAVLTRPIVLAFGAITIASQIPSPTEPGVPPTLQAAVISIALATCALILRSAVVLADLLYHYGTPDKFSRRLVERVECAIHGTWLRQRACGLPLVGELVRADMVHAADSWIARELRLLNEMIPGAIARKQSDPLRHAITAVVDIERLEIGRAAGAKTDVLAAVRCILLEAGAETIRGQGAEKDLQHVVSSFGDATRAALNGGYETEAVLFIDSLTHVGCLSLGRDGLGRSSAALSSAGLGASARFDTLLQLAEIEVAAEGQSGRRAAGAALVGWAVMALYLKRTSGVRVTVLDGLADPLREPPWSDARRLVCSEEWRRSWCRERNQEDLRKYVLRILEGAERDYANLRFFGNGLRESVVGDGVIARVFRLGRRVPV
jgi:hypothetical protein